MLLFSLAATAESGKKASTSMGDIAMHKRRPKAWDNYLKDPLRPLADNGWTRLLSHAIADDTTK